MEESASKPNPTSTNGCDPAVLTNRQKDWTTEIDLLSDYLKKVLLN